MHGMCDKIHYQSRAFTVIELLITVAVIGIIVSVLLSDSSNARTRRFLDSSAREVATVVQGAQNFSLTGVQVATTDRPCGYRVDWVAGSDYSVTYRYKDASDACNQSLTLSSHSLKNGVVFDGAGTVEFAPPHGAVSAVATIPLSKQGQSYRVCVSAVGRIVTVAGTACP